jgi:hypothetical protein
MSVPGAIRPGWSSIIAEIFRRIGTTNRVFVEFGAETGEENNCRFLLLQGWRGLWIEGLPQYAATIRSSMTMSFARAD